MADTIIKMTGGVIRQQKNAILKNVNLEIKSGEFIYLIGKVGSGKSSLLKTLYAELPLEYGSAEVAGFQLKKIKKSQIPLLRRKCGIVFQDFKLLIDRDVYANLEFVLRATGWANKKAIRERIETVLTKVEMLDKQHKMPHQLSGGEQQRIVLARALLNAPPIILADEPTGNIDPETSYRLIELLREICDTGKTVVVATHQYDLIEKYPGRVLCCKDGELFEKCTPATQQAIATETEEAANNLPEIVPTQDEPECLLTQENKETASEAIPEIIPETVNAEAGSTEAEVTETEIVEEDIHSDGTLPQQEEEGIQSTEEATSEKEIKEMIGQLTFPEIAAFDYEIETKEPSLFEENPREETLATSDLPQAIVVEEVSSKPANGTAQAGEEGDKPAPMAEEDDEKQVRKGKRKTGKAPQSPIFDLELD